MVIPVDTVRVLNQLGIIIVPSPIIITDTGNVPSGVAKTKY
jgi:hypothetical protein